MNRLPFFINHFFETYLLISEDTPVGELAQGLVGRLGGVRWAPFPQVKGILEIELIFPLLLETLPWGPGWVFVWPLLGRLQGWDTHYFLWWPIPKERSSQCQRVYHIEPKLLDFHFHTNFVLQNASFLFLVKI